MAHVEAAVPEDADIGESTIGFMQLSSTFEMSLP
jgi:hypothetical protein